MNCSSDLQTLPLLGTEALSEIEAHVRSQLVGRVREFRLEARPEGLVLKGASHTYFGKLLAQHLVLEAASMPILANDIQVL